VPLAALAAYGLWLRVEQHGWTPQRVVAAACVVVAICYAVGYAATAVRSRGLLRGVAAVNVATAFVILLILLALFSPIADPARISVVDQVRRLESGKTPFEQFDFMFLRFDAGRFGDAALNQLKRKRDGADAERISQRANEALDWKHRIEAGRLLPPVVLTQAARARNISVLYPKGLALPDSFLHQDWTPTTRFGWMWPPCLRTNAKCEAVIADLDGDGIAEIVLFSLPPSSGDAMFQMVDDGTWAVIGTVGLTHCPGVRDALRAGKIQIATPRFKEIVVEGQRLQLSAACQSLQGPMRSQHSQ